MVPKTLPPVAVTLGFIDCINRGDLDGLTALMSPGHRLEVFDETPVVGMDANAKAWRGYFDAFPNYVIYPRRITQAGDAVAVLGHTTGSHLGLPDEEEAQLTLIWLVDASEGKVTRFRLIDDTNGNRRKYGLDDGL